MKINNFFTLATFVILSMGFSGNAADKKPFHNGPVWVLEFVRTKPGMQSAYLEWVATAFKAEVDAIKAAGLILSYKVLTTEAHGSNDWNLILMTEVKSLVALEELDKKIDSVLKNVAGDDAKQRQGYKDREVLREPMGERVAREIILSPETP